MADINMTNVWFALFVLGLHFGPFLLIGLVGVIVEAWAARQQ